VKSRFYDLRQFYTRNIGYQVPSRKLPEKTHEEVLRELMGKCS